MRLTVAAGEPWDDVVAGAVADGLAGLECLSGIPGSTGATPIQNVGAYGQEVAETIVGVRALDRRSGAVVDLDARRTAGSPTARASFKHARLARRPLGDLRARRLAAVGAAALRRARAGARRRRQGAGAPLADVRDAVLALRRGKGMVLDPDDHDTWSAGSFFTNPILDAAAFAALEERARALPGADARPPRFPEPDGRVKTSAAWLIEAAGFTRGEARGPGRPLLPARARAHQPRRRDRRAARRVRARDRRARSRSGSASRSCPSPCSSASPGAEARRSVV